MTGSFGLPNQIAYPGEIRLLKEVFDRFCEDHRIEGGGRDAEEIARAIMSLFRAGVFDEVELRESLEEFQRRRTG